MNPVATALPEPVSTETLLSRLNWRYATQKFDPSRKIPPADWNALEQALVLTPSSYGLQPWKFVVVEDRAVRENLVAASWGQRQVVDASHMVVFAVKSPMNADHVQKYIDRMAEVRSIAVTSLHRFRNTLIAAITEGTEDWHIRQVYIAMGNYMTAAALLGIDTCPMEGLDTKQYDEILDFNQHGLKTVAACPAGYRAADDKYAALPKVRFRTGRRDHANLEAKNGQP